MNKICWKCKKEYNSHTTDSRLCPNCRKKTASRDRHDYYLNHKDKIRKQQAIYKEKHRKPKKSPYEKYPKYKPETRELTRQELIDKQLKSGYLLIKQQ